MKQTIRLGSRDSKLAIEQTTIILNRLKTFHPELNFELVTMKTTGDLILDRTLDQIGGKGLFVKELDAALAEGRIDLSVHSLKDMPLEQPDSLPITAFSYREDPRDALVLPLDPGHTPFSQRIGTSSARRRIQILRQYPSAECCPVRGNVLTRLKKLDNGEFGSLILAASGLKRLGLGFRINRYFSTKELIPAAGQGILAVQGRSGENHSFLDCIQCESSRIAALAERAFVRALDGGCSSPIAAYAQVEQNELLLTGFYCNESEENEKTGQISGPCERAEQLGEQLAAKFRKEVV